MDYEMATDQAKVEYHDAESDRISPLSSAADLSLIIYAAVPGIL